MKPLAFLTALTAVTLSASSAYAERGYAGFTLETGDDIGGAAHPGSAIEVRKGLVVGKRFGMIAVEGTVSGFGASIQTAAYSGHAVGANVKIENQISKNLYAFGQLGVAHQWLSADYDSNPDFSGNQVLLGGGIAARFGFMAQGEVWAAVFLRDGDLETDGQPGYDAGTQTLAVGATFGF